MVSDDHPEPVLIGEYDSETAAAIERNALEAEGIQAWTTGELTSGMRAEAPGMVRLYVRPEDEQRARELIASFRDGDG